MNTFKTILFAICVATITFSPALKAAVAVIVHPSNADSLDESSVSKIFLGKVKSFSNGEHIAALIQEGPVADKFNEGIIGRKSNQFKSYWARRAFSGKGNPPKTLSSDTDVLKEVASTPNAIGYIDSSLVDDSVKVVIVNE